MVTWIPVSAVDWVFKMLNDYCLISHCSLLLLFSLTSAANVFMDKCPNVFCVHSKGSIKSPSIYYFATVQTIKCYS